MTETMTKDELTAIWECMPGKRLPSEWEYQTALIGVKSFLREPYELKEKVEINWQNLIAKFAKFINEQEENDVDSKRNA